MTGIASVEQTTDNRTLLLQGAENETAPPPPLLPKKTSAKQRRKARAKHAIKGTPAADPRIKITDSPTLSCVYLGAEKSPHGAELVDPHDAFSDEEIEGMPVVYVAATYGRLHIWRDRKGSWFRTAGRISIRLRDGERVIQVALFDGADEHDLLWFNSAIELLRRGRRKNPEWVRIVSDWADERTFALVFTSRSYVDPYTNKSDAAKVFVCTEKQCREQVHEVEDSHTLDTLTRSVGKNFDYEIGIVKYSHLPNQKWHVDVSGGEMAEATPEMIGTFVNDLNWMSIECANANAKECTA